MFIEGYYRFANGIGSCMDGINTYSSAILGMYCKTQNELLPNIVAIVFSGFIAGEVAVFLFEKFISWLNKKFGKSKEKPYQFVIKFNDLETCEHMKKRIKKYGIETHIDIANNTLSAISENKEDSKFLCNLLVHEQVNNYSVNELKKYVKISQPITIKE